jgi:hypothetical protein
MSMQLYLSAGRQPDLRKPPTGQSQISEIDFFQPMHWKHVKRKLYDAVAGFLLDHFCDPLHVSSFLLPRRIRGTDSLLVPLNYNNEV